MVRTDVATPSLDSVSFNRAKAGSNSVKLSDRLKFPVVVCDHSKSGLGMPDTKQLKERSSPSLTEISVTRVSPSSTLIMTAFGTTGNPNRKRRAVHSFWLTTACLPILATRADLPNGTT